jgi:hypothetical protein
MAASSAAQKNNETPESTASSQSNKKTIIRRLTILKYPVELSFKLKGQPLKSTETVLPEEAIRTNEFDADADWLKDFAIIEKNISTKTIAYVQVNLLFPEFTRNGRVAAHQIHLGVDPDRKFLRPELRIAPNESLEIPLAARYDDLKILVKTVGDGLPIETVSRLQVEFHAALFDDENNPKPTNLPLLSTIKDRPISVFTRPDDLLGGLFQGLTRSLELC